MPKRTSAIAQVSARLAVAHDALILIARRAHREREHPGESWTECGEYPCAYVSLTIVADPSKPPRAALALRLPLPDRGICGNGRAAKQGRSELVASARQIAMLEGVRAYRIAIKGEAIDVPMWPAQRVAVRVSVDRDPLWSRTKLDDDNLQRGLKPYLDGLQDAMLVATDRQFYYDGPIEWARAQPLRGGVTLRLDPQPE